MPLIDATFAGTWTDKATGKSQQVTGDLTVTADPPLAVFGVNSAEYGVIQAALGHAILGWRAYSPPTTGVPATWPGTPGQPEPMTATLPVVSIRPDIPSVIAGLLDAKLAAWFAEVPAGAWVTCWHEGERPNLGNTPAEIVALHAHVLPIFQAHAPLASYGQIFATYADAHDPGFSLAAYAAPGMAFYGLDAYQEQAGDTTGTVLGKPAESILAKYPAAVLAVTETNSRLPDQAGWFTSAHALAESMDMAAFFPFFDDATVYPWTGSQAVIDALKAISQ